MERKLLQIAFALAGLVLIGFGLAGVFFGANFMDLTGNVVMDSYIRFLKGMLLAIGLIYWSSIPDIERHGERISLITFILVLGAVPRLMAVIGHGVPTIGILISLAGELIFAPLLWLWQRRVARAAQRGALT
jgi:Domain of unknown function (DUF4345)